jgi:hypothetical protein
MIRRRLRRLEGRPDGLWAASADGVAWNREEAFDRFCWSSPSMSLARQFATGPARPGADHLSQGRCPEQLLPERSPSGLWRSPGKRVEGNLSRVRIPPSPPHLLFTGRHGVRPAGSWSEWSMALVSKTSTDESLHRRFESCRACQTALVVARAKLNITTAEA